jgi:L-lactate dehydrogenase complex protein LldG
LPAALVPTFVDAFHAVRGHAHAVANEAAAVAAIAGIVRDAGATCVALAALPDGLCDALVGALQSAGVEVLGPEYATDTLPLALDRPTIGITGMAFGIAQTGTLAEVCTDDAVRLVSGLPRTHIGVVYARDLVDTLHDAAPRLRALFLQHDSNVTVSFVSGPSRTGDIELVLTLGVHGPETAHAVIIGDAP